MSSANFVWDNEANQTLWDYIATHYCQHSSDGRVCLVPQIDWQHIARTNLFPGVSDIKIKNHFYHIVLPSLQGDVPTRQNSFTEEQVETLRKVELNGRSLSEAMRGLKATGQFPTHSMHSLRVKYNNLHRPSPNPFLRRRKHWSERDDQKLWDLVTLFAKVSSNGTFHFTTDVWRQIAAEFQRPVVLVKQHFFSVLLPRINTIQPQAAPRVRNIFCNIHALCDQNKNS